MNRAAGLVLATLLCGLSLAGCAGNPYDNDPLLKPPQLIDPDKPERKKQS